MDCEQAVFLTSLRSPVHESADDVDRLTRRWDLLSDSVKEHHLVLDLLNVLSQVPSSFFTGPTGRASSKNDLGANPLVIRDFDADVLQMCSEILEIRRHQDQLLEFLNETRHSFVCQTLSEEICNVLEDLQNSVCKFQTLELESFLGVAKLHSYLKPARQTLAFLASVVGSVDAGALPRDGGNLGVALLDAMDDMCRREVGLRHELVQHLLNACLRSYAFLIDSYVRHSVVNESVADFFIKAKASAPAQDALAAAAEQGSPDGRSPPGAEPAAELPWDADGCGGFTVDRKCVPRVFRDVAWKVLETGVCLRLLQRDVEFDLGFDTPEDLVSRLDKLHGTVSGLFFDRLRADFGIFETIGHFTNLYFFQDPDWANALVAHLGPPTRLSRINGYLAGAKYSRIAGCDPDAGRAFYVCYDNVANITNALRFRESHKLVRGCDPDSLDSDDELAPQDSAASSPGFDAEVEADALSADGLDHRNLVLCCRLGEAARLVLDDELVFGYQLVFKLLLQLKYAQRMLSELALYHLKSSDLPVEPELAANFNLQVFTVARMQQFVRTLESHFLVDVIAARAAEFAPAACGDLRALRAAHRAFVGAVADALLVRDAELVSVLQLILLLAAKFSAELLALINSPIFAPDREHMELDDESPERCGPNSVEGRSATLNALLRNPGYKNVVAIAAADFEKAVGTFRALLAKRDVPLRAVFSWDVI